MRPSLLRRSGLRGLLGRIHPVNKGLLLFMLVLLAQSAYSIFCPSGAGQTAKDIDIIVRTSAAAIFGYFLSTNFTRHTVAGGQTPDASPPRKMESGDGTPAVPTARIGFSDGEDGAETPTSSAKSGIVPAQTDPSDETSAAGRLQIVVATGIGLFCLVTLLILRNLSQLGLVTAEGDSIAASVAQFRDFISGCVGFLIGCPTHSDKQAS